MDKHHPPVGTYPPDEAATGFGGAAWQMPPPAEERPTKKVGTITVAIGLIGVGVLMILRLVLPAFDYTFIARLSPLLLVAYGAEILFASRNRDVVIKYDLVGLVVSALLICTSLVAAAVPELIVTNREVGAAQQRVRDELDAVTYSQLQAANIGVAELVWYAEPARYNSWAIDTTLDDIDLANDYLQVRVIFTEDFASEAEFASACRQALDAMGVYAHNANYAIFYSRNYHEDHDYLGNVDTGTARFGVWLENNYQVNYPDEQLEAAVEGYYWIGGYGWVPGEDYEYLLAHPEELFGYLEDEPYGDDYDGYSDGEYEDYDEDPEDPEPPADDAEDEDNLDRDEPDYPNEDPLDEAA